MNNGSRRLLITSVIVIHAILALAVSRASTFLPIIDAPVTLTLAQMSLLSIWVAFGHGCLLQRWGTVILAGLCLTGLVLWAYRDVWPNSDVSWFIAGAAAMTFAPVFGVTIPSYFVVQRRVEVSRPDELASTGSQLQFSLGHLLVWITILSLLLGLSRLLAGMTDELSQFPLVVVFAGLNGFVCGSVSLAALWALLADARPLVRGILVTVVAAAGGIMVSYASGHLDSWITGMFESTIIAIVINMSLLAFRVAGYRIVPTGRTGLVGPTTISGQA